MYQRNLKSKIIVCVVLFFIAAILQFGMMHLPPNILILTLLTSVIFFAAFANSNIALIILIFSMLLSPEIGMGGIRGRNVVFRIDDFFIFMLFFGWLGKMAINKEMGFLKITALNKPIMMYVTFCILSSLIGIVTGTIQTKYAFFYFLKYIEYFLLFFMVSNNIQNRRQIHVFLACFFIVCAIVSIFAWSLHLSGAIRVTAPFEGKSGEPNTLGGYLLLMMMVAISLLINIPQKKVKLSMVGILCLAFPAFLFTLSRSSWASFIPAFLVLIMLSRKGKMWLIISAAVLAIFFAFFLPKAVQERIDYTFQSQTQRQLMGKKIDIDESTAARVDTWRHSVEKFSKKPFFGYGVSSGGAVVDNQYSRLLIEVGFFGFAAFYSIIIVLIKNSLRSLRELPDDDLANGIIAGFLAGLVGLLVHSLGAATFILIRIMEPFWFLAAIVIALPETIKEEETLENLQESPQK